MTSIGILAYGSLISDPGVEIYPLVIRRIQTTTPFPVEYARLSRTRGESPTVVPFTAGKPVKAVVLVLSEAVSIDEARNLLWRRETRKEGSGRVYHEEASPSAVVIRDTPGFCGLGHVLYTDFNSSGKIQQPNAYELAKAAIASVEKAPPGKDGISYLMSLIKAGVETTLTPEYVTQVLAQTYRTSLNDAFDKVKNTIGGGGQSGSENNYR